MKTSLRPLPLCLMLLLTACVDTAPVQQPNRTTRAPTSATSVAATGSVVSPAQASLPAPATAPQSDDAWGQLRSRFVMADCDADPAIMTWAKRYTKNPQRFETQMSAVLPQLNYVEQIAAKHGVAGEFVLLPWVESQYRPAISRKNRPSGMWQIMPVTAHSMGLRVDGGYDGRLDMAASADAVMTLLRRYHDDLGDWRIADYAYNAGESSVRGLLDKHGKPPDEPAIPRMPVKAVTREHLAKLLALACVVREPSRFNVSLPTLAADQQLEVVDTGKAMPIARAADHAGMSVDALKNLNAAYRNGVVDSRTSSLLLPHSNAEQFRNALSGSKSADAAPVMAPMLRAAPSILADATPAAAARQDKPRAKAPPSQSRQTEAKRYTVGPNDSLWSIAREHSVTVKQLQLWNHLQTKPLKLGQQLEVSAPD